MGGYDICDVAYRSAIHIRPYSTKPRYKAFILPGPLYGGIKDNTCALVCGCKGTTVVADQRIRRVICQCLLEEVSVEKHKN
jgi:hypothetical protein